MFLLGFIILFAISGRTQSVVSEHTFPSFTASSYVTQSGTAIQGSRVINIHQGDYLTYEDVDFGPSGTTTAVRIRYSKGNTSGKISFRLGDNNGNEIASFIPSQTGTWTDFRDVNIPIDDVSGIHDLTLYFRQSSVEIIHLEWIELLDPAVPSPYPLVRAVDWDAQFGVITSNGVAEYIENDDFLTFYYLNFGPSGTTKSIRIRYCKGSENGGVMKIKLGGIGGTTIASFNPSYTGGWSVYREVNILIDDVSGIHDLTLSFQVSSGYVMNLDWFELLDPAVPSLFPFIRAIDWDAQSGIVSSNGVAETINGGDYLTFYYLNFGSSGTTKSIRIRYSKGTDNGGVMKIKLGGVGDSTITTFNPSHTGGWSVYREVNIMIDDISGIHDLTLYFQVSSGQVMNLDWIKLLDPGVPSIFPHIRAIDWDAQSGIISSNGLAQFISADDFLTYNNINFGPLGTTKSIRIRYCKGSENGGEMKMKLGGIGGTTIASFNPSFTGSWTTFREATIMIDDVDGIQDLTLSFRITASHFMDLDWIKLLDPGEPSIFPRIRAIDWYAQSGVVTSNGVAESIQADDFLTYNNINFGSSGTTKSIRVRYSKLFDNGGRMVIKLGDIGGTTIASFTPSFTGGLGIFREATIMIGDVTGIHDLTLYFRDLQGNIMNLDWIELLDPGIPIIFPRILATDYYYQTGTISHESKIKYIHENDYLMYNNLNFGPTGTTTRVRIRYSKGNSGGRLVLRLESISGTKIGELDPTSTGGWDSYEEINIPLITNVEGIHDLVLQFRNSASEIMYLEWIEVLGVPPARAIPRFVPHIPATQYTHEMGTKIYDSVVGEFDANDFVTYSQLNFGPPGTTTSIYLRYFKQDSGGSIEFHLNNPTGTLIAEFTPIHTGSWYIPRSDSVAISGVSGYQDLCIVGKGSPAILNLQWIILNRENSTPAYSCACNRNSCMKTTS